MKKIRILVSLILCSAFFLNTSAVLAYDINTGLNNQSYNQERIDEIFLELNELALEKNNANYLNTNGFSTNANQNAITSRTSDLDNELESLGVHKIDPNNSEDIARLSEVTHNAWGGETNIGATSAMSVNPPNNVTLATLYSVYESTGTYKVNGVTYQYSIINVVDNKGTGTLTQTASNTTLIGNKSTLLSDILKYNFSFGYDQFLGSIPGGTAASWIIGNVFTALNSYNSSSIVTCGNNASGIYTMNMVSVTKMTYIFIYIPQYYDWVLCGSKAGNISFARSEALASNIGGKAVADSKTYDTSNSYTGRVWSWYIDNYFSTGRCVYSPIGSFTINGMYNSTTTFSPKYYSTFMGLY